LANCVLSRSGNFKGINTSNQIYYRSEGYTGHWTYEAPSDCWVSFKSSRDNNTYGQGILINDQYVFPDMWFTGWWILPLKKGQVLDLLGNSERVRVYGVI